jgi:hypothetical protein
MTTSLRLLCCLVVFVFALVAAPANADYLDDIAAARAALPGLATKADMTALEAELKALETEIDERCLSPEGAKKPDEEVAVPAVSASPAAGRRLLSGENDVDDVDAAAPKASVMATMRERLVAVRERLSRYLDARADAAVVETTTVQ